MSREITVGILKGGCILYFLSSFSLCLQPSYSRWLIQEKQYIRFWRETLVKIEWKDLNYLPFSITIILVLTSGAHFWRKKREKY